MQTCTRPCICMSVNDEHHNKLVSGEHPGELTPANEFQSSRATRRRTRASSSGVSLPNCSSNQSVCAQPAKRLCMDMVNLFPTDNNVSKAKLGLRPSTPELEPMAGGKAGTELSPGMFSFPAVLHRLFRVCGSPLAAPAARR